MEQPRELQGWKEIADFLQVSVRTAQELEKSNGMPVRRLDGRLRSRVFASSVELRQWWERQNIVRPAAPVAEYPTDIARAPAAPRRWPRAAAVGAGLCLLFAAGFFGFRSTARQPLALVVQGRTLTVLDEAARPIWSHVLPGQPGMTPLDFSRLERYVFADIDGDGTNELLFNFQNIDSPSDLHVLFCFNSNGSIRWQHRMGRKLTTIPHGQEYAAVYDFRWVKALNRTTPNGGVVLLGGSRGGTSLFGVELLTKDGKVVGEYYHPGWLWSSTLKDIDGDGWEEILLGGVNNAFGAQPGATHPVTMVVLDSRDVAGQGPAPPEDERHFQGLSAGHEKAVLFFPEFGQAPNGNPALFCLVRGIRVHNGAIEASVIKINEGGANLLEATYQFDWNLSLRQIIPSPALARLLIGPTGKEPSALQLRDLVHEKIGRVKIVKNEFAGP